MEKDYKNKIVKITLDYFNLSQDKIECLKKYVEMLKEKNIKINLVSRRSINSLWDYHIVDSLITLLYIKNRKTVMDIGSGGGLPGIPLACIEENKNFILLESISKKANFLLEVKEKLEVKNVMVINERVENLTDIIVPIDFIVVRYVSKINNILKWIKKLLKPGLSILFYKGSTYKTEIEQAKKLIKKMKIRLNRVDKYEIDKIIRYLLLMEVS